MNLSGTKNLRRVLAACLLAGWATLAPAASAQVVGSTAREDLAAVFRAAESLADSVYLVAVTTNDLTLSGGQSASFLYLFATPGSSGLIAVAKQDTNIAAFDFSFGGTSAINTFFSGDFELSPIDTNFVDTDSALAAVERFGGEDFRGDEAVLVNATLVRLPFQVDLGGGPMVINRAVYFIGYRLVDTGEYRIYVVDAPTGVALTSLEPSTLESNLVAANGASTQFAADAVLVSAGTALPDLSAGGEALIWEYVYYSANSDEYRAFYVVDGMVVATLEPVDMPTSTVPLPSDFVSVGEAVAVLDSSLVYGDSLGSLVEIELGVGLDERFPGRAVYAVTYVTGTDQVPVTIYVDARTGVGTAIDEEALDRLRGGLALGRSFPNPFRSAATIEYRLARPGAVRLAVYDALGRQVRELVDTEQGPGDYTVTWDGTLSNGAPAASGVYLYRITSGKSTQTRTMTLVR